MTRQRRARVTITYEVTYEVCGTRWEQIGEDALVLLDGLYEALRCAWECATRR